MNGLNFSHVELPKTILKISAVIYTLIALILVIVAIFTTFWVLPLWWSVGGTITLINYATILLQTRLLQQSALAGSKRAFGGNLYIVRLTLSGLGLFSAAFLVTEPTLQLLSIGAVFVAYLMNSFIILVVGNFIPKKPNI
jgi:hypothetical protein